MIKILFILPLLLLLSQQMVLACSCFVICEEMFNLNRNSNEICSKKHFEYADAVFEGKVLELGESEPENMAYKIKFKVKRAWKFVETSEIYIYANKDGGSNCGVDFKIGRSYLISAKKSQHRYFHYGELYTNSCLMWNLDKKYIGKGYKPNN